MLKRILITVAKGHEVLVAEKIAYARQILASAARSRFLLSLNRFLALRQSS